MRIEGHGHHRIHDSGHRGRSEQSERGERARSEEGRRSGRGHRTERHGRSHRTERGERAHRGHGHGERSGILRADLRSLARAAQSALRELADEAGLDRESRGEVRELGRGFRNDLREIFGDARRASDRDEAAILERVGDSVDELLTDLRSVLGVPEEADASTREAPVEPIAAEAVEVSPPGLAEAEVSAPAPVEDSSEPVAPNLSDPVVPLVATSLPSREGVDASTDAQILATSLEIGATFVSEHVEATTAQTDESGAVTVRHEQRHSFAFSSYASSSTTSASTGTLIDSTV